MYELCNGSLTYEKKSGWILPQVLGKLQPTLQAMMWHPEATGYSLAMSNSVLTFQYPHYSAEAGKVLLQYIRIEFSQYFA